MSAAIASRMLCVLALSATTLTAPELLGAESPGPAGLPGATLPGAAPPKAYRDEGRRAGVPAEVLYGIALTESRHKTPSGAARPWPWTLNVEGKPYFYDSRAEALQALSRFLQQTDRIDVGVMQVHWRFHKERFGSDLEQALDPYRNLRAGAAILREYWKETGSLWKAVGRYHSGTPQFAQAYHIRFAENLTNLLAAAPGRAAPGRVASETVDGQTLVSRW